MAQAQKGIFAEPNLHGLTLSLNVMTDDVESVRRKLARIPALLNELDERFSEALLSGYVAIGSDYWDILYPHQRPSQLGNFLTCAMVIVKHHVSRLICCSPCARIASM